MELIDGKATAAQIKEEIAAKVRSGLRKARKYRIWPPSLSATTEEANHTLPTRSKPARRADSARRSSASESTGQNPLNPEELFAAIDKLNKDPEVDGFIVQLPLPKHIDDQKVIEAIDPIRMSTDSIPSTWAGLRWDCLLSTALRRLESWNSSNETG